MTLMPNHTVRLAETTELVVLDPVIGPVSRAIQFLALGDEILVAAEGRLCFRRLMMAQEAPPPSDAALLVAGSLAPGVPHHSVVLDRRQMVGLPRHPTPVATIASLSGTSKAIADGFWHDVMAEGADRIIAANIAIVTGSLASLDLEIKPRRATGPLQTSPLAEPSTETSVMLQAVSVRAFNGSQELTLLGVATDGPFSVLRFSLPPRTTTLRLSSNSATPAGDSRKLGVALFRLILETTEIPLDSTMLVRGFHRAESNAEMSWRWTDGEALLILPPKPVPQTLSVYITDWHSLLETG